MVINTGQIRDRLVTKKSTMSCGYLCFLILLQDVLNKWELKYQINEIFLIQA